MDFKEGVVVGSLCSLYILAELLVFWATVSPFYFNIVKDTFQYMLQLAIWD